MKKQLFFLALFALLQSSLFAQEEMGSASVEGVRVSSNAWKQWVFGGTALIVAATAIVLIALDNGNEVHSSH